MSQTYTMSDVASLFSSTLDILRNKEHLVGREALDVMSHFIVYKMIESRVDMDAIVSRNYPFLNPDYVKYARFSLFAEEFNEENCLEVLNTVWSVLASSQQTMNVFSKGSSFGIKKVSTVKKLTGFYRAIDFDSIPSDYLGDAYEYVIKSAMVGKIFGQFYTPFEIKNIMLDWLKPELRLDGTFDTVFDITCGTGGFLVSYFKEITRQSREKGIPIDMEFVRSEGLCGQEIEPRTFQLARANMLISTGMNCEGVTQGNSFKNLPAKKFDIIMSNPPFGIKAKYDDIAPDLREEFFPIRVNSAAPLFLQAIIGMLKVGGRCGIVFPEGQEMHKCTKAFVNLRKMLLYCCNVEQIVSIPLGVFKEAIVKTCIIFFTKNKEYSSYSQETPIDEFSTRNIEYIEYDTCGNMKKIIDISIEQLKSSKFSLDPEVYMMSNTINTRNDINNIIIGELFEFKCGKTKASKCDGGQYRFISLSENRSHSEWDLDGENLFISKVPVGGGNSLGVRIYHYIGKCTHASIMYRMIPKVDINLRFMYYYLNYNVDTVKQMHKGVANKTLDLDKFKRYTIPVPPLEQQQEIVNQLDFISASKERLDKIETAIEKVSQVLMSGFLQSGTLVPSEEQITMLKGKVDRLMALAEEIKGNIANATAEAQALLEGAPPEPSKETIRIKRKKKCV